MVELAKSCGKNRSCEKVKLGADASVAAGPIGRNATAETDVSMRAEILSYSRACGLFAGISLAGSTLRPDNDANKRIYGEKIAAKDIVIAHETHVPPAAEGRTAFHADGSRGTHGNRGDYEPRTSSQQCRMLGRKSPE
jgi:lipid-binding SYLF domain-containing protein